MEKNKNIFVIGIGGTGMRCIEAFTHLCAMGMFDDTEVHLLALDTDKDNGNFTRLKNLKEAYLQTKGVNKPHSALSDTFFSAKLHYYQFSPDYAKKTTFSDLYNYTVTKHNNSEKAAVADLLLTDNAKEFNLLNGYRAQTHLGSMLMYHSIIDEIVQSNRNNTNSELKNFIQPLITDASTGHPRVFILGSVFGGTGASSIPIIPRAINEAAKLISQAVNIENNAYFGATLLTSYFSFPLPSAAELQKQKVIATSDKFALNSQAAMTFYQADKTVRKTYQKLYMMGTDNMEPVYSKGRKIESETIIGGEKQENDSHYIELLAAFAAYDFFNAPDNGTVNGMNGLNVLKSNQKTEYLYRTFDEKIDFTDFVGNEKKEEFAKKLGIFTAMSYLAILDNLAFFNQAQADELAKVKITGYGDIDPKEIENLKKYMSLFHFGIENGEVQDGWLRQVHRSAGGGDKFLLNPEVFGCNSIKELEKFNFNEKLFQANGDFATKKFKTKPIIGSIFDSFVNKFIEIKDPDGITNKNEKLIKRTYDTLCKLYNF